MRRNNKMTNETQEQGREGEIDPFYGQSISPRILEIQKLRFKLHGKKHVLVHEIHDKHKDQYKEISEKCEGLDTLNHLRTLEKNKYFDLLSLSQGEYSQVDESPLGRILFNDFSELYDRSDHENMLDASDSLFRNDSDPVLTTVLDESVYELNVPGNTRRERKKGRHRSDIYRRRLQKHVYERYLSEAVGKPITVEEYEREFGFLSGVNEKS